MPKFSRHLEQRNRQNKQGMWSTARKWSDAAEESKQSGNRDRGGVKEQRRHGWVLGGLPWRWWWFISVRETIKSLAVYTFLSQEHGSTCAVLAPSPGSSTNTVLSAYEVQERKWCFAGLPEKVHAEKRKGWRNSKETKGDLMHWAASYPKEAEEYSKAWGNAVQWRTQSISV